MHESDQVVDITIEALSPDEKGCYNGSTWYAAINSYNVTDQTSVESAVRGLPPCNKFQIEKNQRETKEYLIYDTRAITARANLRQ